MRSRLVLLILAVAIARGGFAQEPSLGDVAKASRARQAKSPKPAIVYSNEDQGPQPIKDGDDPLTVFQRQETDSCMTLHIAATNKVRETAARDGRSR